MIYVFLGPNFNLVKKRMDDLINKLNINNIIRYDDVDNDLDDILNEVNYIDLFNEKKLVIVSNFSFKSLNETEEKRLMNYIDNMNDNVIIFRCVDDSLDSRKSVVKALKSKCKVEEVKKLEYKDLHAYVTNMFKDAGIYVDYNKVKRILDLCEYDPDFTISEVEKMLIYKIGEHELTDKDIDDVISKNNDKEMYAFVENIIKKDIKESLNSYKILSSSKVEDVVIIEMIARQLRMLAKMKKLRNEMNIYDIAKELGVADFVVKKFMPYAASYSDEEIKDTLLKLSDCDIDIKINGKNSNYVLENFIMTYTLH